MLLDIVTLKELYHLRPIVDGRMDKQETTVSENRYEMEICKIGKDIAGHGKPY